VAVPTLFFGYFSRRILFRKVFGPLKNQSCLS
jgi:hypothetical protein